MSVTKRLPTTVHFMHAYEIRPRKDHRGVDLISDALPFGCVIGQRLSACLAIDLPQQPTSRLP